MKKVEDAIAKYDDTTGNGKAIDKLVKTLQGISNKATEADETADEEIYFLDAKEKSLKFRKPKGAEYRISKKVRVTNPTDTWDFAHKVNYIVPDSLRGTVNAVQFAESKGLKVKAIGSRHSYSNIMHTKDCYMDLSRSHPYQPKRKKKGYTPKNHNKAVRKLDQTSLDRLSTGIDEKYHFDVPGGMKVHMLNRILFSDRKKDENFFGNKRLFNMDAGDVQAFAGAFSTGTHGTGGECSTYHDAIRSILVVASHGKVYRMEPAVGITDRVKHEKHYKNHPNEVQVELKNSDNLFYSLLVSMGCFGIIYSTIIELKDMTLLKESAEYHEGKAANEGWAEIKKKVNINILPSDPKVEKFVSISLNPYKDGKNLGRSASYKESAVTTASGETFKAKHRKMWPGSLSKLGLVAKIVRMVANSGNLPKGGIIETALKSMDDRESGKGKGYTDLAYRIWNAGTGKMASIGTGIEFAFPIDEAVEVIGHIMGFLEREGKKERGYYINAPMALRFLRPSKAYLAFNGEEFKGKQVKLWCCIEILRVNSYNAADDARERELFKHLQTTMMIKGGRPHWGLNFNFQFSLGVLKELYPKLEQWIKAYEFFNSNGTFDNKFTEACGFSAVPDEYFT